MANQKGRKPATRKRKVEKDEGLKPYQDEITIVFTLVFCILLILSNFNMCGIFGVWVSRLFFGLFGFMNYILPFGIFIGMAFYLSNKGSRKARRKLISVIVLMVVLMALLQLSYTSYEKGTHILAYYEASSESRLGGGMIGGFISGALCYCFDEIASVVILIGIGLLLCMFITEKLFFAPMGKRGYQKMQEMKEYRRVQREEYERNTPVQKQAPVKRKAKTFTIEREPIPDPVKPKAQESVDQNGVIKKEKLGRKSKKKTSVDMEEITPSGIDTMSIVRAEVPKNDESMPVYEEELKNKFNPVNAKMETDLEEINPSNTKFGADVKMEVSNEIETSAEIMNYDAIEPEDMVEPQEVTKVHSSVRESGSLDKKTDMKPSGQASTKVHKSENMSEPKEDIVKGSDIADIQTIKENTVIDVPYQSPSTELLKKPVNTGAGMSDQELKDTAWKLHQTLESFGVKVTITNVSCGPSVTRYELHPEQGVKVSKITGLADDIKLNLAAADVRIEAPIPGKAAVGIEVPNKENTAVMLRELLESSEFKKHSSNIAFAVGKDIAGKTVVSDIAKMPHLLIAGATGSGKSVCINTLIMSILYKAHPDDVKLIMVDPKVVELSVYNGIPHLLIPVVTDPKKASGALNWAVIEMTERYQKFAELGVRDLKGYNAKVEKVEDLDDEKYKKMPQIVIIVDELADLMMVAPGEVEESICRLAQLARAAGIHLVIATQRPSVNVITGVIKANIPSRIAFSVSSAVDSRTIIDSAGAEKLLGKGDMLFYPAGFAKPIRVQGAFVSDQEVSSVVEFLTRDVAATYDNAIVEKISSQTKAAASAGGPSNDRDEYFLEAAKFIIEKDKASIGMLQRVFKIGFNRASRIMDQLYDAGVVGEEEGTKPRKVIMSMEQLEEYIDEYV
nr:DNA translocase FtsK [uncultured Lachnoclostridium sp.]